MTFITILLIIGGAFVALIVGMQLWIRYKSAALKGKPAPELDGKAGKITRKGKAAIFYFYSPSCGACASMTPAVKEMSKSREGVFPVDISKDMSTARKFGVMATPTVVVVKNRTIQEILIGPQPVSALAGHLS